MGVSFMHLVITDCSVTIVLTHARSVALQGPWVSGIRRSELRSGYSMRTASGGIGIVHVGGSILEGNA
jgi:hypothetical protein